MSHVNRVNQTKTIVLVHGFWADASCYRDIIPLLLADGYDVMAVQNPLTSLEDDVAATTRILDRITGPCILVGHSWGGFVITEVGNHERVSGLVYIAALAPDKGESMLDLVSQYGAPSPHFQEHNGFIWTSQEGVETVLATDLTQEQQALIYATQTAPSVSLTTAKAGVPAWKHKPSWYILATNDNAVPPALQQDLSQRMGASTIPVPSSHFPMQSHPQAVVAVIREAAMNASP